MLYYYLAGYLAGYRISVKNIRRISGQISIRCNPNYIYILLNSISRFGEH